MGKLSFGRRDHTPVEPLERFAHFQLDLTPAPMISGAQGQVGRDPAERPDSDGAAGLSLARDVLASIAGLMSLKDDQ